MARSQEQREERLARYETGATAVASAVAGASDADLDLRPPTGWTARQIVHHVADSEAMAYIRLRRLIADDEPILIQGYDEPTWARRLHYDRPIEASLAVVHAVRTASLQLLRTLTSDEWERRGRHAESGEYSVDTWLDIYAEHSHDHADQIKRARRGED
jgi:hypothetical protein